MSVLPEGNPRLPENINHSEEHPLKDFFKLLQLLFRDPFCRQFTGEPFKSDANLSDLLDEIQIHGSHPGTGPRDPANKTFSLQLDENIPQGTSPDTIMEHQFLFF